MEVLSEQIITDAEAKKLLEERVKDTEPKYEQKNALAILKKFAKGKLENVKKMAEELKTVGKLRDRQIVEIINVMPQDKDDLRAVLQKEYSLFSADELDKIVEIVKNGT